MKIKYAGFAAIFAMLLPFMASCSPAEDYEVLRVYNCEDYIYETDLETGELGLVDSFVEMMREVYGRKVRVVYDKYDTNESMLSQVKTGKVKYDLICPSDYAIQKMIAEDLIIPFEDENGKSTTRVYDEYASKFLLDKLDGIDVKVYENNEIKILKNQLNRYARGYMWGTTGILYNPAYDENITADFTESYSMLWDEKYYNAISVKDSMRETFAVGIFKTFETEFKDYKKQYEDGVISADEYNEKLSAIFNSSDKETLDKVSKELLELKNNIFGFEVDSGKQDIQQGKIAINIAWSGDATYAMDTALEETGTILKYILPSIGANIWFDGWVMPKGANVELASMFVDYLSLPQNATLNMEAIGYTPFIACEQIFDTIVDWYGSDEEEIAANPEDFYEKDLSYFFKRDESDETDYSLLIHNDLRGTQIDTQYPDEEQLPSLLIMDDFGPNTKNLLNMWEVVKNTAMPPYFYYIILAGILIIAGLIIARVVIRHKKRKDRVARIKARYAVKK